MKRSSCPVLGWLSCYLFKLSLVLSHLHLKRSKDKDRTPNQTFDSTCSVSSYDIEVTEEAMQLSAEALSRTGVPQSSDTQETVRKMAALKTESVPSSFFFSSDCSFLMRCI